jgi:hypothetical protein
MKFNPSTHTALSHGAEENNLSTDMFCAPPLNATLINSHDSELHALALSLKEVMNVKCVRYRLAAESVLEFVHQYLNITIHNYFSIPCLS